MILQPTTIKRFDDKLTIDWNDGSSSAINSAPLRSGCPCASCKEARGDTTHAQPLTGKKSMLKVVEHSAADSLRIKEVWAVGIYAIGIRWYDGHDTGIYPYQLLRELDSVSH